MGRITQVGRRNYSLREYKRMKYPDLEMPLVALVDAYLEFDMWESEPDFDNASPLDYVLADPLRGAYWNAIRLIGEELHRRGGEEALRSCERWLERSSSLDPELVWRGIGKYVPSSVSEAYLEIEKWLMRRLKRGTCTVESMMISLPDHLRDRPDLIDEVIEELGVVKETDEYGHEVWSLPKKERKKKRRDR